MREAIQGGRKKAIFLMLAQLPVILAVSVSPSMAVLSQEIKIQVLDQEYAAVGAARISIVTHGSSETNAVTDRSGIAKIRDVVAGGHTLIVSIDGKEVYRDQFAVRKSDETKSATLRVIVPSGKSRSEMEAISINELRAPDKARQQYQSALESIRKHDFSKALQFLGQALANYPEYARAHNARGVVLGLTDKVSESEASFREAIRRDVDFAEPHMNLGRLLLESKRASEAREELQKAVDLKQGHVPAIELLIEAMLRIHDENSAVSLVHSLHSRGTDHPAHFHLKIASELERHAMIQLATEQYSLALLDQPSDSERRDAEGALLRLKGRV